MLSSLTQRAIVNEKMMLNDRTSFNIPNITEQKENGKRNWKRKTQHRVYLKGT